MPYLICILTKIAFQFFNLLYLPIFCVFVIKLLYLKNLSPAFLKINLLWFVVPLQNFFTFTFLMDIAVILLYIYGYYNYICKTRKYLLLQF